MNNQENGFWECSGKPNNPHVQQKMSPDENECRELGCSRKKPRQRKKPDVINSDSHFINNNGNNGSNKQTYNRNQKINIEPKPKKDIKLLIALTILNITSGLTTMYGAAQILPRLVGWFSGAVIQALLFLLTSGSTLKHAPWLKWMAVGSFSIISVYTSFFAYYDTLVSETRKKDGLNRAISAHQNLVREIFTPIEEKAQQLENEIKSKDKQIEDEIDGQRRSGLTGCGDICKDLKDEREKLQIRLNQVKPVVNKLRPLFQYDLEVKKTQDDQKPQDDLQIKEPQEIFNADRKALAQVKPKCLPTEPEFVCLPEKYNGSLDPLNPKYKELQAKYFDEDARVRIIEPFLKIGKGEEAGIAAAFMALLIDGCIILLGIGIEIPSTRKPKKIAKTITLPIEGTGTKFLDKLLEVIDNNKWSRIDQELLIAQEELPQENKIEYYKLLQRLSNETGWIEKNENNQWVIYDEERFTDWVIKEGERLIKDGDKNHSNNVAFYLPNYDTRES